MVAAERTDDDQWAIGNTTNDWIYQWVGQCLNIWEHNYRQIGAHSEDCTNGALQTPVRQAVTWTALIETEPTKVQFLYSFVESTKCPVRRWYSACVNTWVELEVTW